MERIRKAPVPDSASDSDDDFIAPGPLRLEDLSGDETEDLSDTETEDLPSPVAEVAPAPVAEVAPVPVADSKAEKKAEKKERRKENKNVIKEAEFLPSRATEGLEEAEVLCDLWSGRCCCRAWTPANRMEIGNKNRKQTFGGRCKASAKAGTLRECCEEVVQELRQMEDYWTRQMDENTTDKEDSEYQAKADLYEASAEFWEKFPEDFNWAVKKQDPTGTADMEDPASEIGVCKNHWNAFTGTGRTMGFRKSAKSVSENTCHPIVTAIHPSRCEGDEIITLNEQGFIWEDPEKFVFFGTSTSKDTKHSPPASVDTTNRSEYKDAVKGKPWTINNASDNALWQEQGNYYW